MSTTKKIEKIFKRPSNFGMVGDGFRVYNYFPNGNAIRDRISPFLMMDYAPTFTFAPSDTSRGVDVHPHKGFETVTIAYKGSVAHHDSFGNSGIINPGDVQWMTAGAGLLHKEYHEENFSKKGGAFEMIQLWVNLPKKDKLTEPHYQGLTADQMGKAALENNGGAVNVIAGNFNGVKGPAETYTEINLFDIRMNAGGKLQTEIPATHNAAILVVEGSAMINGEEAGLHNFVLFRNEGEAINIETKENSVLMLMSGVPIKEPIAQYGPFVMNTMQEIQEAVEEFHAGKFGVLN